MESLIKYVKGNVLFPIGDGYKLIIHCCNDLGLMGSGVARALFLKWPSVKSKYLDWKYKSDPLIAEFALGNIQVIEVEKDISVVNMIGQHGIATCNGAPPIRYEAIDSCLNAVAKWIDIKDEVKSISIHAPRFGAGLAKGKWETIESLIVKNLCSRGIEVTIYDLPEQSK